MRHDAPVSIAARMGLAGLYAALALVTVIALLLGGYPALMRVSPALAHHVGVPWRVDLKVQFALYVLSFAVFLPAGFVVAALQARALERRGVDAAVVAVGGLVALALLLAVVRIVLSFAPGPDDPQRQYWLRPLCWAALVVVVLIAAASAYVSFRPPGVLTRLSFGSRDVLVLAVVLLASALLFIPSNSLGPPGLVWAIGLTAAVYAVWRALRRVALPRRALAAVDVLLPVALALFAWDVRWPSGAYFISRMAKYQNVYVGPANFVLHGGTMLVDDFTQYGPGTTYFFAAFFKLFYPSYGTFALLVAALDVVLFLLIYAVLRTSGVSRLVSATGVIAAVATGVLTHPGPYTMIPNRPTRLILPLLVVLFAVLGERSRRRLWDALIVAVVAISSVVATEVLLYTALPALAQFACRLRLDDEGGGSRRPSLGFVWKLVGGVVVAQVVFDVGTRIASGAWPDWIEYVRYQALYAGGAKSQALAPFGPGALLGAFYAFSVVATVGVLVWNPDFARRRRRLLVALCAVDGVAVAYYSYYAGQAANFNVNKMAPIAALLATLWIGLLDAERGRDTFVLRLGATALVVFCATAALTHERGVLGPRLRETALLAGPATAVHDIRFAAHSPTAFPETPETVRFLKRTMGDVKRPLVLLPDFLTTEVLMTARTAGPLPMGDPYQDSLLPSRVAYLEELVRRLPNGTRYLTRLDYVRLSHTPAMGETNVQLLRTIEATFRTHVVARGPGYLLVYRIGSRR